MRRYLHKPRLRRLLYLGYDRVDRGKIPRERSRSDEPFRHSRHVQAPDRIKPRDGFGFSLRKGKKHPRPPYGDKLATEYTNLASYSRGDESANRELYAKAADVYEVIYQTNLRLLAEDDKKPSNASNVSRSTLIMQSILIGRSSFSKNYLRSGATQAVRTAMKSE